MSRLTLAEPTHGAEWTDAATGCRQRTGFVGPVGRRLFATLHLPAGMPKGGVIICSPLFVEAQRNYRREVLLARFLAQRGLACIRFHYRGTGNSDWLEAVSAGSMTEDAELASEELGHLGVSRLAVVGTRLGAVIATRLSSSSPRTPIVLWEPVLEASRWIREMTRASRIAALTIRGDRPAVGPATEVQPDWIEAVGYTVYPAGFVGVPLPEPPKESSVLLVQLDRQATLKRTFEDAVTRWTDSGRDVTTTTFLEDHPWWFLDHDWSVDEEERQRNELCEPTAEWLIERLWQ